MCTGSQGRQKSPQQQPGDFQSNLITTLALTGAFFLYFQITLKGNVQSQGALEIYLSQSEMDIQISLKTKGIPAEQVVFGSHCKDRFYQEFRLSATHSEAIIKIITTLLQHPL